MKILRSLCLISYLFTMGIGFTGLVASLRLLFDADYSHLLYHGSGHYFASHVLMAAGIVLIIASWIGSVGVIKNNTCLLSLSSLLMAVLIAVEIVFGSMTYAKLDDFHEKVHLWIFWAIQRHYGHDVSNTTIVDLIQQNWQCCGLNSYASWSNSFYSKRHVPKGVGTTNIFIVPKSCCIDPLSNVCENIHLRGIRNVDFSSVEDILHPEGCSPKIMKTIDNYVHSFFGFGSAIVLIQACTAILCCILMYRMIKMNHSILFKTIKSPDSTTLLASEQPIAGIHQQVCAMNPTSFTPSRSPLVASDLPITSLV